MLTILLVFLALAVPCCTQWNNKRTYFYSGHLPTPHLWEADLIYNGNYSQFCIQIESKLLNATDIMSHFTSLQEPGRGGHFYTGWYYVGPRHCHQDQHVYGSPPHGPNQEYSVWQYKGGCGCCILLSGWTFERRGFVTCQQERDW